MRGITSVQTPRIDKRSLKNDEVWKNLKKFGDLGSRHAHFLKIFSFHMFTLSFYTLFFYKNIVYKNIQAQIC